MVVESQTRTSEPSQLLDDVEALRALVAEQREAIARRDEIIAAKDHTIAVLTRLAFGKK